MAKTLTPDIDAKRLYGSIRELGKVGAYRDERTGLMGVNRLALTSADREGRRLVVKWFKQAGLKVHAVEDGSGKPIPRKLLFGNPERA
ncbi:MAG: hypothetical protein AAB576_07220, partial [Elusimicrobiota bacterium]